MPVKWCCRQFYLVKRNAFGVTFWARRILLLLTRAQFESSACRTFSPWQEIFVACPRLCRKYYLLSTSLQFQCRSSYREFFYCTWPNTVFILFFFATSNQSNLFQTTWTSSIRFHCVHIFFIWTIQTCLAFHFCMSTNLFFPSFYGHYLCLGHLKFTLLTWTRSLTRLDLDWSFKNWSWWQFLCLNFEFS